MHNVKLYQMNLIEDMIKNDPKRANNTIEDITKNETILFISFLVKLFELITLIFTFAYFFASLWIILCEFVEDFILNIEFSDVNLVNKFTKDYFIPYYDLQYEEDNLVLLKVFYFAFTSLTTVGFGDYHPISTLE